MTSATPEAVELPPEVTSYPNREQYERLSETEQVIVVGADINWLWDQPAETLSRFHHAYVAAVNQSIAGSDDDADALVDRVARERDVHPFQVVVKYVGEGGVGRWPM